MQIAGEQQLDVEGVSAAKRVQVLRELAEKTDRERSASEKMVAIDEVGVCFGGCFPTYFEFFFEFHHSA